VILISLNSINGEEEKEEKSQSQRKSERIQIATGGGDRSIDPGGVGLANGSPRQTADDT